MDLHTYTIWYLAYQTPNSQIQPHTEFNNPNQTSLSCEGSASTPISSSGVDDLRNLILRILNDNQLLVLNAIAERQQSLTSLLNRLSKEYEIPLSTLKLNARKLRELNLISYGNIHTKRKAQLKTLGKFIVRLMLDAPEKATIQLSD